jgi:hypothetical protein
MARRAPAEANEQVGHASTMSAPSATEVAMASAQSRAAAAVPPSEERAAEGADSHQDSAATADRVRSSSGARSAAAVRAAVSASPSAHAEALASVTPIAAPPVAAPPPAAAAVVAVPAKPEPAPAAPAAPAFDPASYRAAIGSISVTNGIPRSAVASALSRADFTGCYRRALHAAGAPATGRGTVHLAIDETGRIVSASAAVGFLPGARSCIESAARSIRVGNVDTGDATADIQISFTGP